MFESNDKEDASKDARLVSTETVDVTHAGGEAIVEDRAHIVKEMRLSITECGQLRQEFGNRLPSMQWAGVWKGNLRLINNIAVLVVTISVISSVIIVSALAEIPKIKDCEM